MINPIVIRYHLAEGTIRLRPVHGRARLALAAKGIDLGPDGWAVLSEEAGTAVQRLGGPAQTHDRQIIVARLDLEAWLTGVPLAAAPVRQPAPVAVDWLALAREVEALSLGASRGLIINVLVRAGMSAKANPEVVAWGQSAVGAEG